MRFYFPSPLTAAFCTEPSEGDLCGRGYAHDPRTGISGDLHDPRTGISPSDGGLWRKASTPSMVPHERWGVPNPRLCPLGVPNEALAQRGPTRRMVPVLLRSTCTLQHRCEWNRRMLCQEPVARWQSPNREFATSIWHRRFRAHEGNGRPMQESGRDGLVCP